MKDLKKINDRVTVGGQPTAPDIEQLKNEGFRTIVNLRAEGEEDQPMNPQEEGRAVESAGMKYVHLPVSSATMEPDTVDKFREQLADLEGPVLVHCHAGTRAGAYTMMATAVKEGWSGDDTLEKAKAMGFACEAPQLKQFVRSYVDTHKATKG